MGNRTKRRVGKRRRSRRANSDAIITAGPQGYMLCPHVSCAGFVRLEVCTLNHFCCWLVVAGWGRTTVTI